MSSSDPEAVNETIPLTKEASSSPSVSLASIGQKFGTTYLLISALIAAIIPFIQLVIGATYNGRCPIDQRIPAYMIVAGVLGLIVAGSIVLLAVTFMCFISDSSVLNLLATIIVAVNLVATVILSIFIFIWFIVGCVWVFSVHTKVQFVNATLPTFCEPVLYKAAFSLLIICMVWAAIQCLLSCIWECCVGQKK